MTTYAAFQTHVLEYTWRKGDADLTAALPFLIKNAEARINRDAKITALEKLDTLSGLTSADVAQPADYANLRTIGILGEKPATYMSPFEFQTYSALNVYAGRFGAFYTVVGKTIKLLGTVPDDPFDVVIDYYSKVVPYSTDPASPFYDDYPDFYLAAVLIHCYSWLKDFTSAADYEKKFVDTLGSMLNDSNEQKYAGSPLLMRLPGVVR